MLAKIFLEITNVCNLACPFCQPTRRRPDYLSPDRFELFLARLKGCGRRLLFHVKGEPLLHPELGGYIAAAAEAGFLVDITTNGTLLAEKGEMLLRAAGLGKLSLSLHSRAEAEGLEAYWRGIEAFLDGHSEAPGFDLSLRLWSRSRGALPQGTARLWEMLHARYPALGPWEARAALPVGFKLAHRVYLNQAEAFEWPSLPGKKGGAAGSEDGGADEASGHCRGLRDQVGVLVDGSVVPCCLDGEGVMTLGNLLDAPLAEILASPRALAIREGFSRRRLVEPLCRACGYRRIFD
jgi:MoaA/NifB/PqqE/SkfB family radical SAM enzyme